MRVSSDSIVCRFNRSDGCQVVNFPPVTGRATLSLIRSFSLSVTGTVAELVEGWCSSKLSV